MFSGRMVICRQAPDPVHEPRHHPVFRADAVQCLRRRGVLATEMGKQVAAEAVVQFDQFVAPSHKARVIACHSIAAFRIPSFADGSP